MLSLRLIAVALLLTLVSANFEDKIRQSKQTCAKLLRVPTDAFEQYQRSEYGQNHDTYCFMRCVAMMHDLYDDEQGLQVDSMYEVLTLGKTKEEFTELINECNTKNEEEDTKCYCRKAFKPLMCYGKLVNEWRKENVLKFV